MQGGEFLGLAPLIDGKGITIAREAHEIVKEYEAEETTQAAGTFRFTKHPTNLSKVYRIF